MPGRQNQRGRGSRGSPRGGTPGRSRGRGAQRGRGNPGASMSPKRGRGGYYTINETDDIFLTSESRTYISRTASPRGRGAGQILGPNSGSNTPRRRGRGGFQDSESPRGRGRGRGRGGIGSPQNQRQNRGPGGSKLRPDAPPSKLLYQERPLLRPVVFVPSLNTRVLFQEEEEILQATIEEIPEEDEKSHIPTADRVFRVFSGQIPSNMASDDDEGLVELDFNDTEQIWEVPTRPTRTKVDDIEEKFTGISLAPKAGSASSSSSAEARAANELPAVVSIETDFVAGTSQLAIDDPDALAAAKESAATPNARETTIAPSQKLSSLTSAEELAGFYVDTNPSPVTIIEHRRANEPALPEEDLIIYVAPHPRIGTISTAPTPVPDFPTPLPSTSILTGMSITPQTADDHTQATTTPQPPEPSMDPPAPISAPAFESISFSFSPSPTKRARQYNASSSNRALLKQRRYDAYAARQRRLGSSGFGSFGAMLSEAQLRGGRDPRWEERRRGDSDLDWGDEDEGEGGQGVAEGMDLDPDLVGEGNVDAMTRFVNGMVGKTAGQFVTMDDLEDKAELEDDEEEGQDADTDEEEDEDSSKLDEESESASTGDGDEEEIDKVVQAEEELLISERGDVSIDYEAADESLDEDDDEDDEQDGASPNTSFQARLARLRKQSHTESRRKRSRRKGKGKAKATSDDDDDDEGGFYAGTSWVDQDEDQDLIEQIEAILDENEDILTGRDRKAKNKLFQAIHNGAFEDLDEFKPARKSKDKYKDLPEELRVQWTKDREKKAENKRRRALARMEAASDPLAYHKGGRKGRKAMLKAARLDEDELLPNRIMDMTTLVQQIKRFLSDVNGPVTMALPPMHRAARKEVHEMAAAFGLKSASKGKGATRHTTLIKRKDQRSRVNESKVASLVKRGGGRGDSLGIGDGGARANHHRMPRHKEGEEVGKAAPKIGQTNIGFRMLTMMGWSEGQRIGGESGTGLEAPLTAVIKNTKLGLGATK